MAAQTPEDSQAHSLRTMIERSVLLTDGRRAALLASLPQLDDARRVKLASLLLKEEPLLESMAQDSVASAVQHNDQKFFADLDVVLQESYRDLRVAEEAAERADEQTNLTNQFADV